MKFSTIASALAFASSAFAAPNTHHRRARRSIGRHGQPMQRVDAPAELQTNKSDVSYSTNWAGAVLSGTGYTSVTGSFTVPTPSTRGSGSAWVGIDGDTCSTAILQTGIDWTRSILGTVTYDAWYEWYPDYAYDYTSDIGISAGDTITVTVTASSKSGGTSVITNESTGESTSHTFTAAATEADLCEYDAEWIVEDYESGSSLVAFADFGTVTFTDASATHSGGTVDTSGAGIIDMRSGTTVLTDCSASGSSVTCDYV